MKSFLLGKVLISSTKRTKERKKWIFMGKQSWKRKHLAKKNSSWKGPEGGEHIGQHGPTTQFFLRQFFRFQFRVDFGFRMFQVESCFMFGWASKAGDSEKLWRKSVEN